MKTLRFIGMALLAVVMCVNFIACSDDDDDNNSLPNSLAGTEWTGTDPYDYIINVTVGTSTCKIDVKAPDGSDYYTDTSSYTYDPSTGWVTAEYGSTPVSGQVKGNTITVSYEDYTITLRKK